MDNSSRNIPIVTVEQFTKIIEMQYKEGLMRPIFGLGRGGIGKTESIIDLAIKMGIGHIDIRLLMYNEGDLKGIPYPNENHTFTIWLQNNILPRIERDGERGFLVLDEITSVPKSIRTAAYQLLNERKLGEYILPKGWMVICLGNGEDDGGDYQGMEGNFLNRCSVLNVVQTVESWKTWAMRSDINYLVTGYVSWRESDLHTYDPNSESELLFASPRSWKAVSDILNRNEYDENDPILNARILSNLGTRVGHQFIAYCKYKNSIVHPDDIIEGKPVRDVGDNLEILFMTMQSLIKVMSDLISTDKKNHGDITKGTMQKCANGIRWILSLKALEHKTMGLKDFISTHGQIVRKMIVNPEFSVMCPELSEFAKNNSILFKRQ
ncbi:hypothetical protein OXPF_04060 [Oxobacter pfennigii]|uniref:ATPase dynein-related AAA domain-containing protein n=1 Tax=Oxobacter pfennigii TaxID=36849 RepID=A0A0P8X568_9CLOT|nr:hypothetical protein [Oxobacter pfennigii]KPU45938.1 hypothetical protein OXPF_04060 [Oxobacter pfennigii]